MSNVIDETAPQQKTTVKDVVVFLAAAAATGYFWYSYSGPYRWFAELQMALLGAFSIKLTALLTLAAVGVPCVSVVKLCQNLSERFIGAQNSSGDALQLHGDQEQYFVSPSREPVEAKPKAPWVYGRLYLAFAAVMGWIIGGCFWFSYSTSGELSHVTIEDWEAGKAPRSRWVHLHGFAVADLAIKYGEQTRKDFYVPVLSENWRPGQPVQVFLEAGNEYEKNPRWAVAGEHEGLLTFSGLPGPVKAAFEEGNLVPAKDYAVLEINTSPQNCRQGAIIFGSLGFVAMALQLVYSMVCAIRATRGQATLASQAAWAGM